MAVGGRMDQNGSKIRNLIIQFKEDGFIMESSTVIPLTAKTTLINPLLQEIPGKYLCFIPCQQGLEYADCIPLPWVRSPPPSLVNIHCHYSQIHSDLEWQYLLGFCLLVK